VEQKMDKRWVFTELVNGKDDTYGFLAYSLYKHDKNEYAETLRDTGDYNEKQISAELRTFHNQTVNTPGRINAYKEKAELMLSQIADGLENEIRLEFEAQLAGANQQDAEIKRLESEILAMKASREGEIRKAGEDAILNFHRMIDFTQAKKRGRISRSLGWYWNGFAGIFATITFAVVVYGICTWALPQASRDEIVNGAFKNLQGTLFQQPNIQLKNDDAPQAKKLVE
jgi:hypothetical protein